MNCYFSSMPNKLVTSAIVITMTAFSTMTAFADAAAEQLLQNARYQATLQNQDLKGFMKKDGRKTPVGLYLREQNIQFHHMTNNVEKRFHMRLKENEFDLLEIVGDKTLTFDDNKLANRINGTDLSFEDLSMRFLYWKNSAIVGNERVGSQKCNIVRLRNPGKSGAYGTVDVWIHEKYGALMRVVGYGFDNNPLKRFQVTDLMKVAPGVYTLERMRVDSIVSNKVAGTTYLEFEKPKKPVGSQQGR